MVQITQDLKIRRQMVHFANVGICSPRMNIPEITWMISISRILHWQMLLTTAVTLITRLNCGATPLILTADGNSVMFQNVVRAQIFYWHSSNCYVCEVNTFPCFLVLLNVVYFIIWHIIEVITDYWNSDGDCREYTGKEDVLIGAGTPCQHSHCS